MNNEPPDWEAIIGELIGTIIWVIGPVVCFIVLLLER